MRKKTLFTKINLEYLFLGIILVFGFFLRVYGLGNPSLWIDEATSSMASKMILAKGLPIFDSGLLYGRAYLFHYLQAFFLLFGQTDFLARFVTVIFGMLTIILAYFIGKEYSKSGGLISALFMSVFYLEVFFSRQARFYQLFQLMFFLSLYLLYKSKNSDWYLYGALIALFITINTQIAGLVLCPFFILHILIYNKKYMKYLAIIPGIPLVQKFISARGLASDSTEIAINYASKYFSFAGNMKYLFILVIPGIILGWIKKKRLTGLMILPSIILLIGIFSLQTFALRYAYFMVFPLVLYSSLLFSFFYDKYGKIILIPIFLILIIPSNLIFPHTYVNMIKPIDYNYNDYSAPEINFKDVPAGLVEEMRENTLVCLFSSNVEWYIKKPNYVFPFSMDGRGDDQISIELNDGRVVDVYSGALIINEKSDILEKHYYVIADYFSVSKLKTGQREMFGEIVNGCEIRYENLGVKIYECG